MALSPIGLVLGSVLAEREGVADPQARTRIAFLGGFLGSSSPVTGLVLTTVLARREAESASSAPVLSLVQVPNVEDQDIAGARQELEALGLKASVSTRDSQSYTKPPGTVISQEPTAFTLVFEGATVTLTVCQDYIKLPAVTNQPFADAKARLEELGVKVRRNSRNSETVPKDSVVAQNPAAGTPVPKGATVSLAVSKGRRETSLVDLPDLIGRPFGEAREELQDRGLKLKRVSVDGDGKPPDEVVDQEPKAGKVKAGSQVTLSLSNGQSFGK